MFKKILGMVYKKNVKITVISRYGTNELVGEQGQNLLDVTNRVIDSTKNIYGVCGKQLCCTTCSVKILKGIQKLPKPTQQQQDILCKLRKNDNQKLRMACQIKLTKQIQGLIIQVPDKLRANTYISTMQ